MLLLILLWASIASNIILLMWIIINGNAAKRMESILANLSEMNRNNSELAKELLKEMTNLSLANKMLSSANDAQRSVNTTLANRVDILNKFITENGGNPDKI